MRESDSNHRTAEMALWAALVMVLLGIAGAFLFTGGVRTGLPELPQVAEGSIGPRIIGPVGRFSLTNQAGEAVGADDFAGKVWIADIIFTRCPGPCATMTRRMAELQGLIPIDLPVKYVTITTDPEFDRPQILAEYGSRFGADFLRWSFLTGEKSEIVKLATDGLKLVARPKAEEERTSVNDLFIHSTVFALIDRQGRLRGVFETVPANAGEDGAPVLVDPWEVELKPKLLRAIEELLREP